MESRTKTPHEMLLINGLAKVANDPIQDSETRQGRRAVGRPVVPHSKEKIV
jgi:hypothetical protein